jgi:hypothetical protein
MMAKKTIKGAALASVLGMVFQFGGCLSSDLMTRVFWTTAGYSGLEFILDNDAVFDLFEDGNVSME